jgi:hypothetical protein
MWSLLQRRVHKVKTCVEDIIRSIPGVGKICQGGKHFLSGSGRAIGKCWGHIGVGYFGVQHRNEEGKLRNGPKEATCTRKKGKQHDKRKGKQCTKN